MIISKTPLRIPFFSGGTDLPAFYTKEMGAALSCTINKYVYVTVHKHQGNKTLLNGSEIYYHKLTKETLKYFDVGGISIHYTSDINQFGTGLGASSAYVVGLSNALCMLLYGVPCEPRRLAEIACLIEIDKCGCPIGKQDQYAAAFGGFNLFYFHTNGNVSIENHATPDWLVSQHLLHLVNTKIVRDSSKTINKVFDEETIAKMRLGKVYAEQGLTAILSYDESTIFNLLKNSWNAKKAANLSMIDNSNMKNLFNMAESPNAAGKILGAGGGGFMLFYTANPNFSGFESPLFKFVDKGSEIIYSDK